MAAWRATGAPAGGAASTSTVVKQPSATVGGKEGEARDYLICEALVNGTGTPTMAGWELLGEGSMTGAEAARVVWFGRYATESGEKSHTVSISASLYNACHITAFKEPHPTAAVVKAKDVAVKAVSVASKEMKVASLTPEVAGCVSYISAGINQAGTGEPPTNWTERQENTIGDYVSTRDNVPKEATGEQTIKFSASRTYVTAQILIRPLGGQSVALTPATEADSPQALSYKKPIRKTLTPATESSAAVARAIAKRVAHGVAVESDTAQPRPSGKRRALVPAVEVDAAQSVAPVKPIHKVLSPATEADQSVAVTLAHRVALAAAAESDGALALGIAHRHALATAVESSAAIALQVTRRVQLALVTELGEARALSARRLISLLPAEELDAAQEIAYRTVGAPITLIAAGEVGAPVALQALKPIRAAVTPVVEVGAAVALDYGKPIRVAVAPASEVDVTVALLIVASHTLVPALEINSAVGLLRILDLLRPLPGRAVPAPRDGRLPAPHQGRPSLPRKGVAQ